MPDDQQVVARDDLPVITLEQFLRSLAQDNSCDDVRLSERTLRMILRDCRDQARRFLGQDAKDAGLVDPQAPSLATGPVGIDMAGSTSPEAWRCTPCGTHSFAVLGGCYRSDCPVRRTMAAMRL